MDLFTINNIRMTNLISQWEPVLMSLNEDIISTRRNKRNRNIKQIVGHMIDSATNNTHRIIHLQYQNSPINYPDYANLGNNDRWIAIQNYENENQENLVQLWKFANLHIIHTINNVKMDKLDNIWLSALGEEVSLKNMILSYLPHFELHLNEIEELINQQIK